MSLPFFLYVVVVVAVVVVISVVVVVVVVVVGRLTSEEYKNKNIFITLIHQKRG